MGSVLYLIAYTEKALEPDNCIKSQPHSHDLVTNTQLLNYKRNGQEHWINLMQSQKQKHPRVSTKNGKESYHPCVPSEHYSADHATADLHLAPLVYVVILDYVNYPLASHCVKVTAVDAAVQLASVKILVSVR